MNHRRSAALGSLLLGLVLSGSAEAMVLKCEPDGTTIRNTRPLLLVDGQVKGDLPAPGPDSTAIGTIKADEILRVDMLCLEITEAGASVMRDAVSVITKAGALQFMKSQLQGLVDQQEEYRKRTGEYARNLSSLDYVETRAPLVIDMSGGGGGWAASVSLAGVLQRCGVSVRSVTGKSAPAIICI